MSFCSFAKEQLLTTLISRFLDDVGLRRAEQARPRPQPEVHDACAAGARPPPRLARPGTWRSPQVFSLTKAVDKVRALPELRKQDAAQYIGRFCRAQLRCWAHARQHKKVCPPPELAVRCR